MFQEDLISVIIPCYNIEKYVERCIKSIFHQTYENLEIIAIDDGSSDHTGKILDDLKRNDARFVVLHFSNGGLSYARNKGLDHMHGQYVMCVDGDDFIHNNMIAQMYEIIKNNKSDIVACNYYLYYGDNNLYIGNKNDKTSLNMSPQDALSKLFCPEKRFVAAWAKLYRASLFRNIRYPEDIQFGEDMFITPELFHISKKISYLDTPLYYYNQEGESLVRSKFSKQKLNMVIASRLWVDLCEKNYPNLVVAAKENLYLTIINICSHLCEQKEYYPQYECYRDEIKGNAIFIQRSRLSSKDKLKAVMIYLMGPKEYSMCRKLIQRG